MLKGTTNGNEQLNQKTIRTLNNKRKLIFMNTDKRFNHAERNQGKNILEGKYQIQSSVAVTKK